MEPADPAALAQGVIQVLTDPEKARRMAEAGYRRYLAACTPAPMVRTIEAVLVDLSTRSRAVVCPA